MQQKGEICDHSFPWIALSKAVQCYMDMHAQLCFTHLLLMLLFNIVWICMV